MSRLGSCILPSLLSKQKRRHSHDGVSLLPMFPNCTNAVESPSRNISRRHTVQVEAMHKSYVMLLNHVVTFSHHRQKFQSQQSG